MPNSPETGSEQGALDQLSSAGKNLIGAAITGVRKLFRLALYPAIFIGGMIFGGTNLDSEKPVENTTEELPK